VRALRLLEWTSDPMPLEEAAAAYQRPAAGSALGRQVVVPGTGR
jgi:hypothetical protein